jgi:hypothetical protein
VPLKAVGEGVHRVFLSCCRLFTHLRIPNGRWLPGKLLQMEFSASLADRDAYLGMLEELNDVAGLKADITGRSQRRAARLQLFGL